MTAQPKTGALLALLSFSNFIIGMGAFVVIGIVSPIAEGLGSFGLAGLGVAGGIGALVALAHLLASQRLARPIAAPGSLRF